MDTGPQVSVAIAAYNRPHVLRHAIRSVLDSTYQDFEVIVVGDHCTDDTGHVVTSFGDPRVRFVNLPENCGDQSGPNNVALELARGRFIAFLNQDDLYFPDHLHRCLEELGRTGADFVWSSILVADPIDLRDLELGRWQAHVGSTPPAGVFDPLVFCVASSWLLSRDLVARVGRWRPAAELFVSPSQDWMFRAWRSGARMVFDSHPSVLAVFSGARPSSYARRESPEHDVYAKQIRENPRFREELLEAAAVAHAATRERGEDRPLLQRMLRRLLALPRRWCEQRDVHPLTVHLWLRAMGPGRLVDRHRRFVGLGALPGSSRSPVRATGRSDTEAT